MPCLPVHFSVCFWERLYVCREVPGWAHVCECVWTLSHFEQYITDHLATKFIGSSTRVIIINSQQRPARMEKFNIHATLSAFAFSPLSPGERATAAKVTATPLEPLWMQRVPQQDAGLVLSSFQDLRATQSDFSLPVRTS